MKIEYNKYCISINNLTKSYISNENVLCGLSFNVKYGEVFGFLGPNGAGKSTTIKILTSLEKPTSGNVHIFGKDIAKHSKDIRKRIGVVFQQPVAETNLTVEQSLDLYGLLWGVDKDKRKERIKQLLNDFDLSDIHKRKNDDLSIGQRRRVQIAREFMHDMDLLFLDEPTVGLDPSARRHFLDYIKSKVKSGLTVFFTTHIMEEAEYLCDKIAILNRGKIVAVDTPMRLKNIYGENNIVSFTIKNNSKINILNFICDISKPATAKVIDNNTFSIECDNPAKIIIEITDRLDKHKIKLENITVSSTSLEDVYLKIVNN